MNFGSDSKHILHIVGSLVGHKRCHIRVLSSLV